MGMVLRLLDKAEMLDLDFGLREFRAFQFVLSFILLALLVDIQNVILLVPSGFVFLVSLSSQR